ncbi:MAG: D-alanine--D-alanine ligase [Verrucomicrobiota bacterium]
MNTLAGKKISVLMGGPGSERDVSVATGTGVAKALRSLGAEVVEMDVRGADFELPTNTELVFNAIHGTFGEDGQLQRILEERGTGYTGEGVAGSELAFDKIRSKEAFREHGVSTPSWQTISERQRPTMPIPYVIKPPREGSTVGIRIVKNERDVDDALSEGLKYDRELLVEKYVAGRELTIGVLGDQALPVLEIIPKGGFYDFANKYPFLNPKAGAGAEHICPASLSDEQARAVQELALRAHRALDLEVYSRVDVIMPENGEPTVLELNTIPGMTETSLLPEMAAAAGITYPQLCVRIIQLSWARMERAK